MRAARSGFRRGVPRLAAGMMAAGAVLGSLASPALAKTHAHSGTHQSNAVKWCEGVASNQNVTINTPSQARAAVKLIRRWAADAPNKALKHDLSTFAARVEAVVAAYPHRPSSAVMNSYKKSEKKVVSEVGSVCSAAGASGTSGNSGLGNSGNSGTGNSGNSSLGNSGDS